jgi:hypothetical protein
MQRSGEGTMSAEAGRRAPLSETEERSGRGSENGSERQDGWTRTTAGTYMDMMKTVPQMLSVHVRGC